MDIMHLHHLPEASQDHVSTNCRAIAFNNSQDVTEIAPGILYINQIFTTIIGTLPRFQNTHLFKRS